MTTMRLASLAALAAAAVGCTVGDASRPAYPTPAAEPSWYGPPGGAVDPGWGYTEGEGSYEGSYPPAEDDPAAYAQPSADPASANYALGDLTEAEMEASLQPYGEWVEDPIYGWIWIPYTTVVGADFTPYDSGGEWVYTDDYGWSFDSDYDWGWVAFHFGNWMMYDDASWGWVPGNTWAPHHCDWRHGSSGTIGWRPTPPEPRDHRTGPFGGGWRPGSTGPANTVPPRGHSHGGRRDPDATWTFSAQTEFGLRNRPTRFAQSDGLRDTTPVVRPPFGARDPSRAARGAAGLMGHRLQTNAWMSTHPTPVVRPDVRSQQRGNWGGGGGYGQSSGGGRPWMKPPSPWGNGYQRAPSGTYQRPTWNRPPDRQPQRPAATYGGRGYTSGPLWTRPNGSSGSSGTAYQPPSRPSYTDRGPRYTPPSRPSGSWNGGNTYQPPSRPSWTPPADRAPSRGSWSSGSSGSRPSWNTGGSYRAPERPSFSPSQSTGGGRSWSPSSTGGSRSSGSWSPSSSSGGSRSSGSYSSGGSRSSGSSSGSSSSGSSGGSRSSGSSSSGSSGSSSRGSGGGSWRR